jgi:hypothetical protein
MQFRKNRPKKILKIFVSCAIAKPLNGSFPGSNTSHLLRLYPVAYTYKNGKQEKEKEVQSYHIKGLRGALRHAVMEVCHGAGLEVCHTTDKEATKDGTILLPPGFHLLGACGTNGESCVVHNIFGSKGQEGRITVYADPIANIPHKTSQANRVQNVHIATENRICKTFDGKTAQDFGERYFSGEFAFEIDVTHCASEQVGLMIQAIMALKRLGRGYNAGYGHLKVLKFQLLERIVQRVPVWIDDFFAVVEDIAEESLKDESLEALQTWEDYLAAHS